MLFSPPRGAASRLAVPQSKRPGPFADRARSPDIGFQISMPPVTLADSRPVAASSLQQVPAVVGVVFVAVLALIGVVSIWPTVDLLWALWTTDPLKSIGMFIPLVSSVLILRAWRSLHWQFAGTWWGFVVLALTSLAVVLRSRAVLVLVVSPRWSVYFPPHSLVVVAYATGVVLLFGGTRLLRAAIFPLVLLWFVNPIPHVFNTLVDLPLQRASAHVARGFAHLLGQPLTTDQMRLMFTPDFGMFIAPGCNGIRGALTMGFIALIAAYLNRFRWYVTATVVAAAVLLGYLFNFLRLCLLVVYYIVALHLPRLQQHGEMADYIIGALLFLVGTFLLTWSIRNLATPTDPDLSTPAPTFPLGVRTRSLHLRFAAMLALFFFGVWQFAPTLHAADPANHLDNAAMGQFPQHIGGYTLVRSWNENLNTGLLLFHWAEYAPADTGPHISLGVAPLFGSHDTLVCHSARGEDPLWQAALVTPTANSPATSFSAAFFNDGATQFLELSTVCNGAHCGEYTANRTHLGFVYSRPPSLLDQRANHPIPILLRAETLDTATPSDTARRQLSTHLQTFLAALDLPALTQPYRRP